MNKSGVIYMSIPFHSRITRQNRSKNERAMPKGSKITLLGLEKNPEGTSHEFLPYLSRKKRTIQIGPPEVCVWGGGRQGLTLFCVRTCIKISQRIWKFKLNLLSGSALRDNWQLSYIRSDVLEQMYGKLNIKFTARYYRNNLRNCRLIHSGIELY